MGAQIALGDFEPQTALPHRKRQVNTITETNRTSVSSREVSLNPEVIALDNSMTWPFQCGFI